MKHYLFLLLLSCLFLNACSKSLTINELEVYLADPAHGLTQQQEVNGIAVKVAYRPSSLVDIGKVQADNYLLQQYYLISISRNNKEILDPSHGFSTYSSLLQTLAFRPQEYVQLTSARGDTIYPSNAILERTYGMGSSTRILIAFPANKSQQDVTLHLREFGLQIGNLQFPFQIQGITSIPLLKQEAIPTAF